MSDRTSKAGTNGRVSRRPKPVLPEVYFDSNRQHYWIQDQRERWMPYSETSLKRLLRSKAISAKPARGEIVSDLDLVILDIQHNRNVDYAASLAGYQRGVYEILGSRVLVVDSPQLIEPKTVTWDTLKVLLCGLLVDDDFDQTVYFFGWLKVALESLRAGKRRPGQALVLAGPKDCGKSFLQKIITRLLGGRMASPYQYMTGATPFNGELFRAEHLVIEDNAASTDIRARRHFGSFLKTITVNDDQPCCAKGRQTVSLTPFWRLSASVNDEPENLMVLPPVDDSIEDKLILLRAYRSTFPMPTQTDTEREAFWDALMSELPGFVHFLSEWEIPKHLESRRFGITHFHHPELLHTLDDLAPETQLLDLIDGELFAGPLSAAWEGKAEELERRLTTSENGTAHSARRLLAFRAACGTYLGRLLKKYPYRIDRKVRDGHSIWTVGPPRTVGQ